MNVAQLPANMQSKIAIELCPVAGLDGFCWAWTGYRMPSGYGQVGHEGKVQLTHRVAYEQLVGTIPDGLQLDHLCVNKPCCNPSHTEPVTGKVNCERTDHANKPRCVNGHPLIGPNLRVKQRANGLSQRECRACCMAIKDRADEARGRQRKRSAGVLKRRADMLAASEAALRAQLNGLELAEATSS